MVPGRDFQVFYIAGWMVRHGEASQLYNAERLQAIQNSLHPIDDENPPYFFFYPPMTALLFEPLAIGSYSQALWTWYVLQVQFLGIAGVILFKSTTMARGMLRPLAQSSTQSPAMGRAWRPVAWLAMLAFYPLWDNFLHGQLAAVLLMILLTGFLLQRHQHRVYAGAVLSLLAMKPHFFVGALLWLALRRDWRSLAAMLGGLFAQLAIVAATMGVSVIPAYLDYLPTCLKISQIFVFSPYAEHGFAGSLQNLLQSFGFWSDEGKMACTLLQAAVAVWAGWMLYRVIAAQRVTKTSAASDADSCFQGLTSKLPPSPSLQEQACAILFMFLLTPHALTYDLLLLALPLASLWTSTHWRLGIALYAAASIPVLTVYNILGFSLTPVVMMIVLYRLSRADSMDRNAPVSAPIVAG
jgi:hypothetical protein